MIEEIDAIEHLINVEKDASVMMDDAQKEADSRISKARSLSESQFKEGYDKIVAEVEAEEKKAKTAAAEKHDKDLALYKEQLESCKTDLSSFNSFMDSLVFAG